MRHSLAVLALSVLLAGAACANAAVVGTGHLVRAGDAQDGKTITIHPGDRLLVTLKSTYWQVKGSSNRAVLKQKTAPASHPTKPCIAGGGCGTVTATYVAVADGTARVTADRTSCGEAMGCTSATGHYALTVRVVSQ